MVSHHLSLRYDPALMVARLHPGTALTAWFIRDLEAIVRVLGGPARTIDRTSTALLSNAVLQHCVLYPLAQVLDRRAFTTANLGSRRRYLLRGPRNTAPRSRQLLRTDYHPSIDSDETTHP